MLLPGIDKDLYEYAVKENTDSRIGYFNDVAVAAVIAERDLTGGVLVNAMTCLPAYQGLGIEGKLLEHLRREGLKFVSPELHEEFAKLEIL